MREIVFDTETTGLSPTDGHRLVEIGCIELVNRCETGREFHAYFHPDRDMPFEAERVHGLSITFLSDKPRFHEQASTICWSFSATRRWSRTMPDSTSAFSTPNWRSADIRRSASSG